MMLTNMPLLQRQVDAGALRVLAYTSQRPGLPPVPTLAQYGLTGFGAIEPLSVLLAPAGTPEPVIARLTAALQKALESPEVKTAIENQKQYPFYQPPAELGARCAEVIEKAGIQLTP